MTTLGKFSARHVYSVGTTQGAVEVYANDGLHAVRIAERAGYVVRDVNMVG